MTIKTDVQGEKNKKLRSNDGNCAIYARQQP